MAKCKYQSKFSPFLYQKLHLYFATNQRPEAKTLLDTVPPPAEHLCFETPKAGN